MKIKSDTEVDDIEVILYASPKRENDIDDIETIPYVSLKREMALMIRKQPPILPQEGKARRKLTKIIYKQPKLETAVEIEIKLQRQKKKFIKSELEQDKVDIQVSRESDIK